jgi:hypothetical protein
LPVEASKDKSSTPKSQIQNPKSAYSIPHDPRWAAPQAPHGPGSNEAEAALRGDPPTANTDNSFSTRGLEHCLQTTSVEDVGTIFSNVVPQWSHLYSNSGMGISSSEI